MILVLKSFKMKHSLHIIILFLAFFLIEGCRSSRNFQIQCFSVSEDAIYTVDVIVESKKVLKNLELVKLDAIDGILFRGISGSNCVSQKPMVSLTKAEVSSNGFIQSIYGSKKAYRNYITAINALSVNPVTNLSRPLMQITYRVSVNKDLLRRDLISAGVVKSLNSGF